MSEDVVKLNAQILELRNLLRQRDQEIAQALSEIANCTYGNLMGKQLSRFENFANQTVSRVIGRESDGMVIFLFSTNIFLFGFIFVLGAYMMAAKKKKQRLLDDDL